MEEGSLERIESFETRRKEPLDRGSPKVYRSLVHRAVAMPLGGIGAGSISINPDGELVEWQIFNRVNPGALVPGSLFILWTKSGDGRTSCKLLAARSDFPDYPPYVEEIEFVGEYPIAYLWYKDSQLPVRVKLEAFSPFIPLNPKDSALPAILFLFSLRNPGRAPLEVSMAASLQNAVGYDGYSPIWGVESPTYGGNFNSIFKEPGLTAVHMESNLVERESSNYGTMTLAMVGKEGFEASYLSQYDAFRKLWNDLSKDGKLENVEVSSPSPKGRTWNGALAGSLRLDPEEEASIPFLLSWHFPNRFVEWDPSKRHYRLGNMYNNWFDDSLSVARYVSQNLDRFVGGTRLFHEALYESTLPRYILDCVSSQLSTIRSPTCMWLEDGTFAGFEGCGKRGGCCPMNCTHVWNYEQSLAKLFPSLERSMRRTDLRVQMEPDGMVHHRTVLPLSLPRSSGPATDGQLGTILKVYREHLQSSDRGFLDEHWAYVRRAMEYVFKEWDPGMEGVIRGAQPNTYDIALTGANAFIGSLYLASLRAMEEMAKVEEEPDLARLYRETYEKGRRILEEELWNGEYYVQGRPREAIAEPVYGGWRIRNYGEGCLSDQLLGQWWAHILNLGYILPEERVKNALRSIVRYNWKEDLSDFVHLQRVYASGREKGLFCCSWPKGGRPEEPILYCDEVWTGIEYQVAAHLIYEGFVEEGLRIVKAARERYDGVRRNPWNEVECGDHYVRSMSSWSLLLALQGYEYDGVKRRIGFKPRLRPGAFKSFFSAAEGWGTFEQRRGEGWQEDVILVAYGSLSLRELIFQPPASALKETKEALVLVGDREVGASFKVEEGSLRIMLSDEVVLREGGSLRVRVEW